MLEHLGAQHHVERCVRKRQTHDVRRHRPIEAVGTSTAGFVGTAPNPDAFVDEAVAINNWSEFRRRYVRDGDKGTDLANAVYGFFLNGGSRCYVVNTKADGAIAG